MKHRKAFVCDACEGVYADQAVSQCDCMPGVNSFTEMLIVSPKEFLKLDELQEQVECSTITRDNMEGRLNIATVKLASMKQQRDELLAALIVLRERHQIDDPHHAHICEYCLQADAAIKKAKGGA